MTSLAIEESSAARVRLVRLVYAVLAAVVVIQGLTGQLASWSAALPLLLGWLTWLLVRRSAHPSTPIRALVLVMAAMAGIAVVELAVGLPTVVGDDHAFYALKARITTPLGDHNELAGWLLVAVALAAASRRSRPALWLLALGLGATLSRGALVAAALGLAVAVVFRVDRAVLGRVGAAVAAAAVIVLGATLLLDTSAPPDGPDSSVSARADLWEVAVDDIADDPWLGVGLGGFEDTAVEVTGPNHHAHNGTLHALAELGVLAGLVAAVRLPWATWVLLRRRGDRWLQVAGLGGLLLLAHDQVEALAFQAMSEVVIGGLLALSVRPAPKHAAVPS